MLNRTRLLIILVSAGILFNGCAIERKFVDNDNRDYGAPVNLDQRVALVLDSSYSTLQIDDGSYIHLFGDAIANGTENVFRNVFRKVGRLDKYPTTSNDHWDFVAVPKILDFDYSGGAWRWNDHINVISVEGWCLFTM